MTPEEAYNKASALMKKGNYAETVEFTSKMLLIYTEDADLFSLRAVSYFHLKDKRNALANINRSLEIQPHYSYRYSSRAFIKDAFGDTAGAIEDYKMCIALDPEDAVAYNNLGLLEEKLGYAEKSKEHFQIADKLAPFSPEADFNESKNESNAPVLHEDIPSQRRSKFEVIAKVFKNKQTFKEFITFIGNGFKLKE
ncbi:MAG: tetratricopeptide repeat protein [Flavobacteriales bacterium]